MEYMAELLLENKNTNFKTHYLRGEKQMKTS